MPVLLELINQPDPADLADLEKIYADYPMGPVASIADWLFDQRQAGKSLVAGRFNGRLLAALWLRREGEGAAIEHLCVRAITRRRGTARQLLTLLLKQAGQFQLNHLRVAGGDELAGLWQELGFTRADEGWRWQP
jgi:GNAT superfamily N-acetyltransferase